jgi:class 3 adenylate cyclase
MPRSAISLLEGAALLSFLKDCLVALSQWLRRIRQALRLEAREKDISILRVGFIASANAADLEGGVGATLQNLLERLIEDWGGTVVKFADDHILVVFGARVNRDNDAEAAVRTALQITETVARRPALNLWVRAGVNTGEVALEEDLEAGEAGVSGDVFNTAIKVEKVAPINGVAVGEATYRLTKDVIAYQKLETGQGKPVQVWLASRYPKERVRDEIMLKVVMWSFRGLGILVILSALNRFRINGFSFSSDFAPIISDGLLVLIIMEIVETIRQQITARERLSVVLVKNFLVLGIVSEVRHLLALGAELSGFLTLNLHHQAAAATLLTHRALLWDLAANGLVVAILFVGFKLVYPLQD